jgi:predicted oxidoreductase (fatty acid repression mutant protein)
MTKPIPEPTPQLNRLRAAAGLIPIIEDGSVLRSLSQERASIMATFCAWAYDQASAEANAQALAQTIQEGLERIEARLASKDAEAA